MTARTRTVLLLTALILGALLFYVTPPRCNRFCSSVSVWVAASQVRRPTWRDLAPLPCGAFSAAHALCNRLWYGVVGLPLSQAASPFYGTCPASAGLFHAGPRCCRNQLRGSALGWWACCVPGGETASPDMANKDGPT